MAEHPYDAARRFGCAVDRALRRVEYSFGDSRDAGTGRDLQLMLDREALVDELARRHTDVLLVFGADRRGQLATAAYRAAADLLERGANPSADLEDCRAQLDSFIYEASRSIRGRRPLRIIPNWLLDAVSHDAAIRRKGQAKSASGRPLPPATSETER
jgi:hypothetical protein